jgi:cell division GTPase FtsZ
MKLGLVGVGQAGGKIVDALLQYQEEGRGEFISSVAAVNTARVDLLDLDWVPEEQRVLIGQSRVQGRGVGADNDLGADIAAESRAELLDAVEGATSEVDAFLVVAALGGGTGSGVSPLLARYISEVYSEPVYGLGVLPGENEGGIYTLNAARSFRTFVREADNVMLFDNDAWRRSGETLSEGFAEINAEIARRFGVLFSAGEFDPGETVAETVLDASEVINTLDCGGVSTVGYAAAPVERDGGDGLLGWLRDGRSPREEADTGRVTSLVRQATHGRLTLPCEVTSAERGLLLVAGPPDRLSRDGIESARTWLEAETGTMEVRGGDYPVSEDTVAVLVLLAGVTDAPRIESLQRGAVENRENRADREADRDRRLEDLLDGEDRTVDPLF